jgi:hypothetical protein
MLYCQPCGEVFIGGYKDPDPAGNNAWFLSPDFPDLERVPDRTEPLRSSASMANTLSSGLPAVVHWLVATTPAHHGDGSRITNSGSNGGPHLST